MNNADLETSHSHFNDNDMSIAPPIGAMSAYLSKLISSSSYRSLREVASQ